MTARGACRLPGWAPPARNERQGSGAAAARLLRRAPGRVDHPQGMLAATLSSRSLCSQLPLAPPPPCRSYGDWTCFMGYASGSANDANRCANLPHSYQLGWSSLTQLDASSLPKGYTYTAYVASNSNFRRAGVRIMAGTWLSGQDPI